MTNFIGKIKNLKVTKLKVVVSCVVLLVIVVIGIVLIVQITTKEPEFSAVSESSLKEIIEIDELSTLEYFYNSIASVNVEDEDAVKYHVAYKGTVRLGIVFEEVDIVVDEENKKIIITVPEIKVMDCDVQQESMDFIFIKEKYETETVSTEAYAACVADLETKVLEEAILFDMARENAISSIEALICPWIEQIDGEYEVSIK